MMVKELKGWHVATMFVCGFAIIIAVNLTLAFSAVRTFPGLEVKNSYVASQHFDAERDAQLALAWQIDVTVEGEALVLAINDANGPVTPKITRATLGRPTHVYDDQELVFTFDGQTHWAKILPLGRGNWNLRLAATAADGTEFKQRIVLWVPR